MYGVRIEWVHYTLLEGEALKKKNQCCKHRQCFDADEWLRGFTFSSQALTFSASVKKKEERLAPALASHWVCCCCAVSTRSTKKDWRRSRGPSRGPSRRRTVDANVLTLTATHFCTLRLVNSFGSQGHEGWKWGPGRWFKWLGWLKGRICKESHFRNITEYK